MPSRSAQSSSNVLRLAAAQALAGANTTVVYATAAIIGEALAPSKSLATLPISVFVVGMAASTLPAGAVAQRHGRRAAFMLGTLCGVLLGLLAALGIYLESFALFCAAMAFGGAYAAVVLTFRFAAAECVEPHRKARALSTVLAGGVLAGVLGPQLVSYTMDAWSGHVFAGTYLAASAVAVLAAVVLGGVDLPRPARAAAA
ncbi:transporter, major facilitator domain protein, partial [Bordetella bronchiseptica CA90 BB1334]